MMDIIFVGTGPIFAFNVDWLRVGGFFLYERDENNCTIVTLGIFFKPGYNSGSHNWHSDGFRHSKSDILTLLFLNV